MRLEHLGWKPPVVTPELAELVEFTRRDDLPPELVALGTPLLAVLVHPFVDGTGHTARMLACGILKQAGYSIPTLIGFVDCLTRSRPEIHELTRGIALGTATTEDYIAFHLHALTESQEAARRLGDAMTA